MREVIHGRLCVRIGDRWFAVSRDESRADRIHSQTQLRSSWQRQMSIPQPRLIGTRSIKA